MQNFLCRGSVSEKKALEECRKTISGLEEEPRTYYAENINLGKHELESIFLVDGCFILELLIGHAEKDKAKEQVSVLNNVRKIPTLQHDLAILENQIPFCVLQNLFKTIQELASENLPFSLTKYVLLFFCTALGLSEETVDMRSPSLEAVADEFKHLLDILHHVYLPKNCKKSLKGQGITRGLRSATQLFMSGIQFQVGDTDGMLDVKFSDGVITIPPLRKHLETRDYIFRNLIALEQCSVGDKHHIASYAKLMKSLIRSPQDAELLHRKGIITYEDDGGNIEDVCIFFDSLCREVVFEDFYFTGLCEDVNAYHKSWLQWSRVKAVFEVWWNGFMVALKEDYFKSPLIIISFIASVSLFIFMAVQTIYTVYSYYSK